MKIKFFYFLLFTVLLSSCNQEEFVPLPTSYLRIDLPKKSYYKYNDNCPFSFEIPSYSLVANKFKRLPDCYKTLYFPEFKAELLCSYKEVDTSIFSLIEQIRSNVEAHNFRATGVNEDIWINSEGDVYGNTFEIKGDVACNFIFYLTDSANHFFSGELLFLTKPNYDSLQPVLEFIQKDIVHLVETFNWEDALTKQMPESQ